MDNEICIYSVDGVDLKPSYIDLMVMSIINRPDIKGITVVRKEESRPVNNIGVDFSSKGISFGYKKGVEKVSYIQYTFEKK